MHPQDNSIEALVESQTWSEILDLLTKNMAAAGLFESDEEASLALEGEPDHEYREVASLRQCLDFLPTVLENVSGCDSDRLLRKLLESPIVQTVAYLRHVLGEFKAGWCGGMVIDEGINTDWIEYEDEEDYEFRE